MSKVNYILPGGREQQLPPPKLLGVPVSIARSAVSFPPVSTQQMRDVTCVRTNRTETARPAGLDRSAAASMSVALQTTYK